MAYRRRVSYKYKAPKVKVPKKSDPRPKGSELAGIYKKIIAGSITTRIAAMHEALGWWDNAIPYFISKGGALTASQTKQFEVANKARNLGAQGSTDDEQETGLKTALTFYEKIWGEKYSLPKFKPYWEKFQALKPEIEKKAAALASRYQPLTEALNACFQPLGVQFDVHKASEPRQYDGASKIMLSTDLSKTLMEKVRTEGLLPAILSEATGALQAASVERDNDGNVALNLNTFAQQVPVMLDSIMKYCASVPRAKVFRSYDGVVTAAPAAASVSREPKATRASKAPRVVRSHTGAKEGLVGGRYRPGTAMAQLYERLADEQTHKLEEILKDLPVSDPKSRLKYLMLNGQEAGLWTVDINWQNKQVTLTRTKPSAQAKS